MLTDNPNPPQSPVRLIFIHHSTGGNWLSNDDGGLGIALRDNNYFVSDACYGWGPNAIGDRTDLGQWWEWFRSTENSSIYLEALYKESGQNSQFGAYSRLSINPNPNGQNEIVMFKSCFPNSGLKGNITDPIPNINSNPLRGEENGSEYHTISNAKGIYIDLLEYFRSRQDKLFIVITAPPLSDGTYSANARSFNLWLVNDWLRDYGYNNVFVFDFFNILTTNGGSPNLNDLDNPSGNHHRWINSAIQHQYNGINNTLAYPSEDDHPNKQGNLKATSEFLPLLNIAYNRWKNTVPLTYFYKINGTILHNGSPLPNAAVHLTGSGNPKDTTSISDSNGKYEFVNIQSGNYLIQPSKGNLVFSPVSYNISLSSDTILNFSAQTVTGVKFNDSALESEVRAIINKPTGEITDADMQALTNFSAVGKSISDLTGLEKAINLTELDLNSNQIINITPVSGLTKLTRLILYSNQISNIDSLKNLNNLTTLLLGYNPLTGLNALSNMKELLILHLPSIQATSFNSISSLTKLRELQLEGNHIADLQFLSNLNDLEDLYLNDNQISDLNPLSGKANLTHLVLYSNRISSVSGLSNLKKLRILYLGNNLLEDISPLSGLVDLTQLNLSWNRIHEIVHLKSLVNLTNLDISDNLLSDRSLKNFYTLKLLNNSEVWTNVAGEYKTGYFDLRGNIGFSEKEIKDLDAQLPLISLDHILWNPISTFYTISGIIKTGGAGLSDVSIRLKGGSKDTTAISDAGGNFIFPYIPAGDAYIMTPSKETYNFYPVSDTLGILLGDSLIQFTAAKITGITEEIAQIPETIDIFQNFPNPFNSSTTINFQISKRDFVSLRIFDILGKEISSLIDGIKEPGRYSVTFSAKSISSGIYYYTLKTGGFLKTKKLVYIR